MNSAGRNSPSQFNNGRADDGQDLKVQWSGCFGREIGLLFAKPGRFGFSRVVNAEQHDRDRRI
jgi:hypothetical protein